jgi:hypothetical protein
MTPGRTRNGGSPPGKARQAHRAATRPQRFPATSASRHRPDHAQNMARIGRPCRARNSTTPSASDAERTPRNPATKAPPARAQPGKPLQPSALRPRRRPRARHRTNPTPKTAPTWSHPVHQATTASTTAGGGKWLKNLNKRQSPGLQNTTRRTIIEGRKGGTNRPTRGDEPGSPTRARHGSARHHRASAHAL